MKINKTSLTFEEIWYNMYNRNFVLIHEKETMIPYLYDVREKIIYELPDGYLDYDTKRFRRS